MLFYVSFVVFNERLLCNFIQTVCEKRGSGSEDIYLFLSCDLKLRFSSLILFHT